MRAVTCPFYDELDAVLGTRADFSPPVVLEKYGTGSSTETDQHIDDPGMKCMPPHIQCAHILYIL